MLASQQLRSVAKKLTKNELKIENLKNEAALGKKNRHLTSFMISCLLSKLSKFCYVGV